MMTSNLGEHVNYTLDTNVYPANRTKKQNIAATNYIIVAKTSYLE